MNIKLTIILVIVLVTLVAGIIVKIRNDAAEGARLEIERKDNEAGNAADRSRSAFDICHDRNGVFDFRTGKCSVRP